MVCAGAVVVAAVVGVGDWVAVVAEVDVAVVVAVVVVLGVVGLLLLVWLWWCCCVRGVVVGGDIIGVVVGDGWGWVPLCLRPGVRRLP